MRVREAPGLRSAPRDSIAARGARWSAAQIQERARACRTHRPHGQGHRRGDVPGTNCACLGIALTAPQASQPAPSPDAEAQCRIPRRHGHPELHASASGARRARQRARWRAPTPRRKNRALMAIAAADRARRASACSPPTRKDVEAAAQGAQARCRADRPPDAHAEGASRRWRTGCGRSRRCPIRSARSASCKYRPSGIQVGRMRVPLGVIGIIYESRPNVTADAAGAVHQVRQRRDPARRLGSAAFEPGDRRLRARGPARRRAARERGAGGRDHRPRRGRRADHACRSTSTSSCRAAARA